MTAGWKTARSRLEAVAHVLALGPRWAAGCGVLALLATSVLQRLDLALGAAHQPRAAAGGIGDIASPARLGSRETAVSIAQGWVGYQEALPLGARSVRWMTVGYLGADLVLMAATFVLLVLWWSRMVRLTVARRGSGDRRRALAGAVRWTWFPAMAYLSADLVETVLATGQWRDLDLGTARAIAIASTAKWVALLLAAVPLLIAEWLGRSPKQQRTVRALRGQFLVAGLIVAVLLALSGDLGLQVDDLLIRSGEHLSTALWSSLFALGCGAVLYAGGQLRLHAYVDAPRARPIKAWMLGLVGAAGLAGLVAGLWLPGHRVRPEYTGSLHVLALVGAALLVFAVTSAPKDVRGFEEVASVEYGVARDDIRRLGGPWLAVLGALPGVALALSLARAATSQAASGARLPDEDAPSLFVPGSWPVAVRMAVWVVALLLVVAGLVWLLGHWRRRLLPGGANPSLTSAVGALLVGAGGIAVMALSPVQHQAQQVGAASLVFVFAGLLATAVTGLVSLGDQTPARGSLAVLGFRRTPWTGLLVLLVLGASLVDRDGVYFDAVTGQDRALPRPPGLAALPLVEPVNAFAGWTSAHARVSAPAGQERAVVPLVFVAAAGGGIKAAYWTAAGMSCAVGDACGGADLTDRVFLASGVSGGSLGLAAVRGHQEQPTRPAGSTWYEGALGRDFVSPSVAAFLFRDLPNSVLRLPRPQDNRASALQDAWQSGMPALKNPFYRPALTGPRRFPYLVLNGASVEDGCRLAVSELLLAPSSGGDATPRLCAGDEAGTAAGTGPQAYPVRNAAEYLCDRVHGRDPVPGPDPRVAHNIRLSTAALLSARFPYVSPSGDLSRCGTIRIDGDPSQGEPLRRHSDEHTYVVDGGLFDNSGASAVTQVWEQIAGEVARWNDSTEAGRACIVPRLLVLDNHYDAQEAPSTAQRPQQLTAPPSAKNRVYELRSTLPLARAEAVIQDAAATALSRCGPDRAEAAVQTRLAQDPAVVVLHPVQRPGSKAPLGWTLSDWSREDMQNQLTAGNACRLLQVRAWFGEQAPPEPADGGTSRCVPDGVAEDVEAPPRN